MRSDRQVVDDIVREWQSARPDLDTSPMAIFGRLVRAYAAHEGALTEFLASNGLTRAAFDVLANLRRSPAPHRKTPSELAASSLITSGGITFRLDRLEADGLIRRIRDTVDRRVSYAELTDAGRDLIDRVFPAHLEREAAVLRLLPARDRTALPRVLDALEQAIVAHGAAGSGNGEGPPASVGRRSKKAARRSDLAGATEP